MCSHIITKTGTYQMAAFDVAVKDVAHHGHSPGAKGVLLEEIADRRLIRPQAHLSTIRKRGKWP